MSWIQKLSETYERCAGASQFANTPLLPIGHTTQQAQIEIVIDGRGAFRRAGLVSREDCTTIVPCTEQSGGRAGTRPVPHPLCDKLQYVAGDFVNLGGEVTSGFAGDAHEPHREYLNQLSAWANSPYGHAKLNAILAYVREARATAHLIEAGVLPVDKGRLLTEWTGDKKTAPAIFKVIAVPQNSFVRWRVELSGELASGTWEDHTLVESWIAYYASLQSKRGMCMVTGENTILAEQHPSKLRDAGDKAKLISSNDLSGYTFRGRFVEADQACGVGFGTTQKAHNALRWLIKRQGYRNDKQAVVTWAVAGQPVPDPFQNSRSLFLSSDELRQTDTGESGVNHAELVGDVGQSFARRISKAIAGYRAKLSPTDDVVVMALDSATPGRMAITFYREFRGWEFLDRVSAWHEACAWHQDFGRDSTTKRALRFIGAPSPSDIAEAAFGPRVDTKLRKTTVERLLPCIVDGRPLPRDLVDSAVRRTSNRLGLERWQWEKSLGIACALHRSFLKEKEYSMTLETERTSRDYLYGRLLALAEHIEGRALYVAGENRDTTAARLMHRFSDRPASTWPSIERALLPYKTRLRSKRPGFLYKMEQLVDEVVASFSGGDFLDDRRLSGEFLLGYHCQRRALNSSQQSDSATDQESTDI
jgi:CRISPR-associated protein Csd1